MKKLILINGTMGIGKSTVSTELNKKLNNSVWLDGDWCWRMNPFIANEENKKMVQENIVFMLRNFLKNSNFEYVIFCWVIHLEEIFDTILKGLDDLDFKTYKITLMCDEDNLKERIQGDIDNNIRDEGSIIRSMERLSLYENMNTIKIDTSSMRVSDVVDNIIKIIN